MEILKSPRFSALLISVFFLLVFLSVKDPRALYGDSGIMYLQVHDIVKSDYTSLSFYYPAGDLDPEYQMVPLKKPFLAKVGDHYYIDFPPYFPLLNSVFYSWFSYQGLYIINLLSLIGTLFLFSALPGLWGLNRLYGHLMVYIYAFATTASLYAQLFHEYTLAIFLVSLSLFLLFRHLYQNSGKWNLLLSGMIAGISLFFRLELVFVYFAMGVVLLFNRGRLDFKAALYFSLSFSIPFLLLLFFNYKIHGHPLGLRYTLTMEKRSDRPKESGKKGVSLVETEKSDKTRRGIIEATLFSKTRGLLYQSPFFLLALLSLYKVSRFKNLRNMLLPPTIIFFMGGTLILLTAPNHGDHFAPRYLFGLFPPGILLFLHELKDFQNIKKRNLKYGVLFFTGLLLLQGLNIWKKNFFWLLSLDKMVLQAENVILNQKEDVIAFIEYASSRNLLLSFTEKKMVVLDNLLERETFLESMERNHIRNFAVALPVAGNLGKSTMNRVFTDGKPDPEKIQNISPLLTDDRGVSLMQTDFQAPFIILHYAINDE